MSIHVNICYVVSDFIEVAIILGYRLMTQIELFDNL
jgi:hypothetical protein